MIALDYVKLLLKNINFHQLEFYRNLNFTIEVCTKTGEIFENIKVASYHHCKIRIIQGKNEVYVVFTGSIHKMWNSISNISTPNVLPKTKDKGFNGNTFTFSEFCKARKHLEWLFSCKSDNMKIQNIEFGTNIHLPFAPPQFLKGLLFHKGCAFNSRYRDSYYVANHCFFDLKLYDKGMQYRMNGNNILRVEIKIKKTEEMKRCKLSITSLADITLFSLNKVLKMLTNRFDEVVYYDMSIREENLSKYEKKNLLNYNNPRYWMDLKPNRRDRPRKKLKKLIEMHSDNIGRQIRNSITQCTPK